MNIAFIDGQNLYYGLKSSELKIDYKRFRVYLRDKYNVKDAYYFLGFIKNEEGSLYENLQKAGFILKFKAHNELMAGKKKGNVDTEIVFEVMKRLIENPDEFDKILIVSGDGDYKNLVDYLREKDRFLKILLPTKTNASSLYKKMGHQWYDYIENAISRFGYTNQKGGRRRH